MDDEPPMIDRKKEKKAYDRLVCSPMSGDDWKRLAGVMQSNPCHLENFYRVMMRENPSTHAPHEPETPAMLYPRGGINVCLRIQLSSSA